MRLEDAWDTEVSRKAAQREIARHDCDGWDMFVADCGDKPTYMGSEILMWLGY